MAASKDMSPADEAVRAAISAAAQAASAGSTLLLHVYTNMSGYSKEWVTSKPPALCCLCAMLV